MGPDLTTPFSLVVCHDLARICYGQHIYQIGSLHLHLAMKNVENGVVWGS